MTLPIKMSLRFAILIIVAAIIALMPETIKSSLSSAVNGWGASYADTVENSHDGDGDHHELVERLTVRIDDELSDYVGIETHTLANSSFYLNQKPQRQWSIFVR